jgi:tRNA (guanosine-2'-O-)-methyltransferase
VRRDSDDVAPLGTLDESDWPEPWTAAGVIEVLEPLVLPRRRERIEAVLARRITSVTLLLDGLHDPHNGAAVLRSCDAFGVQELHVVPRTEPFVISSAVAQGTERWVDLRQHASPEAALEALARRGFELVATHPRGELVPEDLPLIPKLCLVLGNEHHGIRPSLARAARRSVRIEMRGFVESLNVSVSAAILLRVATLGRPGDLDGSERQRLYARGLYRSVPRASEVLAASVSK